MMGNQVKCRTKRNALLSVFRDKGAMSESLGMVMTLISDELEIFFGISRETARIRT